MPVKTDKKETTGETVTLRIGIDLQGVPEGKVSSLRKRIKAAFAEYPDTNLRVTITDDRKPF